MAFPVFHLCPLPLILSLDTTLRIWFFSRLHSPSSLSLPSADASFHHLQGPSWDLLQYIHVSFLLESPEPDPALRYLTSAEERGRIKSLDLLPMLCRMLSVIFARSVHHWLTFIFTASCSPGPPGPSLKSCFPASWMYLCLGLILPRCKT